MGDTHEVAIVDGFTQITQPVRNADGSINVGAGQVSNIYTGGLLTQQSNIGHYARDVFTVVPEVDLTLGYQITPHIEVNCGYTFLFWSQVARAGDQIDLAVDPNQIPQGGPTTAPAAGDHPIFAFHGTGFWAQGVNLGLTYRW